MNSYHRPDPAALHNSKIRNHKFKSNFATICVRPFLLVLILPCVFIRLMSPSSPSTSSVSQSLDSSFASHKGRYAIIFLLTAIFPGGRFPFRSWLPKPVRSLLSAHLPSPTAETLASCSWSLDTCWGES